MNNIKFFVLILYLKGVMLDSCELHRTCRECIRDATVCDWCYSDAHVEYRCKSKSFTSTNKTWCQGSLERLRGSVEPVKGKDVSFSSQLGNVTQIKPQSYQIYLRPGEPQNFNFSFKLADNYPIDMYFLFDSSGTMNKLRKNTAQQSKNIYEAMIGFTQNVYMGMGTFVDKNMLPFTINVTKNESYSFRHHLSLTNDSTKFQNAIDEIKIGLNRDSPEAGLDALAQAIVCKNVIGWRNESRKILVLMTDESYHAAGDGRSAGLFKPYDGQCYTEGNVYTKEQEMDYPSVAMINKLARENDVIVIFAVSLTDVYSRLVDVVSGSKMIDLNDLKTDEIVKKLKGIYEDITTKIKLNVNAGTDASGLTRRKDFQISFDPDCSKDHKDCYVPGKGSKNFSGEIQILEYGGYDKTTIDVSIEGIAEKLTLDINIINTCGCEKTAEDKSSLCDQEKRECGVCLCKEPKYGDKCQCNRLITREDNSNSTTTCKGPGMEHNCNKQGTCSCGTCSCQREFTGPYCECSVSNCPIYDNEPCANHGKCQCDGTCKCDSKWAGDACQCNEELCATPFANTLCNSRGRCNCDTCDCNDIAKWDMRITENKYCVIQPCANCHEPQCNVLTDCAVCLMQEGKTKNDCNCTIFGEDLIYTVLDELSNNITNLDINEEWHLCTKVRSDIGCYTNFTYRYENDPYRIHIQLQKKQNCAEIQYIFGALFLLSVLLVGILTLLGWKLITYLRDRREYLQFMKDHVPDAAPCSNPLYEPATTEFRNPAFGKSVKY